MIIEIALLLIGAYLLLGLLFAVAFVIKGITVVDETAHGCSIGCRVIILPGAMLLWPLLLKKWIKAKSTPHD